MTTRDDIRVRKALQGADFPATTGDLLRYAQSRGVDEKSLQALRALPERRFQAVEEVTDAVPQEPEGQDQPGGTER